MARRVKESSSRSRLRLALPPPLARECAVFLDIDGTLLRLATTPDGVPVDGEVAALLPALLDAMEGAVALITGRSIADADRYFPGAKFPMAGQHGCERRAADGSWHANAPYPAGLSRLRDRMAHLAARHPGLVLEDKGMTLAMHYRRSPGLASYVHRVMRAGVSTANGEFPGLCLQRGKGVLEIRPDGQDKGTAIVEFMSEPPFRGRIPVFAGDDCTDEFGFAVIDRLGGWTVKVGAGATRAKYRLGDVDAVRHWIAASLDANPT